MLHQGAQVLAGRYKLISPLKRGGMSNVWTAEHLTLHSKVAIKLLDDERSTRSDDVARFVREARAAAQIRSPHIVQILDVGVDNGVPFIAMELLSGESLAERLDRHKLLTPREVSRILGQVARGVARAHAAGLVHRDLKPSNIFLERNEEEDVAKVLDFGIAKALVPGFDTDSGATRTGMLVGSPHYMSPEQAESSERLDQRTDIWAFGVIACECMTGQRPFDQASLGSQLLAICAWPMPVPSQLASVPAGFDAWFSRACARDLSQRFGTILEAAQALRRVCGDESSSATARLGDVAATSSASAALPASSSQPAVAALPSRRPSWLPAGSRLQWAAAAVVLLLLALGLGLRYRAQLADQTAKPAPYPRAVSGSSGAPAGVVTPALDDAQRAGRGAVPNAAPLPSMSPSAAPPLLAPNGESLRAPLDTSPGKKPKIKVRTLRGSEPVTIPMPPFKEDPY